jgi:hypothetical protein
MLGENVVQRPICLKTEEFYYPYIADENKMDGACSSDGEGRCVYRVLVGKFEGKRQLGRPRLRWEYNIKMEIQEVGCRGMDWIELARDRARWLALVDGVMNLSVP